MKHTSPSEKMDRFRRAKIRLQKRRYVKAGFDLLVVVVTGVVSGAANILVDGLLRLIDWCVELNVVEREGFSRKYR